MAFNPVFTASRNKPKSGARTVHWRIVDYSRARTMRVIAAVRFNPEDQSVSPCRWNNTCKRFDGEMPPGRLR